MSEIAIERAESETDLDYFERRLREVKAAHDADKAWIEDCTKGMVDAQWERNQTLEHMDYLLRLLATANAKLYAALRVVNAAQAWAHGNKDADEDKLHDAVREWEALGMKHE